MTGPEQLAEDLWTWSRPRQGLPDSMRSYLLRDGEETVLVDPHDDPALDELAGSRVRILVTTPLHVRDSERLWARWRGSRQVTLHGHARVAGRLEQAEAFEAVKPGVVLTGGLVAHGLGRPPRPEQPWQVPVHRAIAFGDTVVEVDGELRVWPRLRPDALARGTYEDRLLPTLRVLADLPVERVLVTHGRPILSGGAAELARALERPIWKRAALY
jgi:hypothetical protein